jgi:hypothetical protein
LSKPKKLKGQVAALIIQTASQSCDAEGLTGGSADKKVNWPILIGSNRGEVAMKRRFGIVVRQHGAGERLNLAKESGLPAKRMPSNGRSLDARTDGTVNHAASLHRSSDRM